MIRCRLGHVYNKMNPQLSCGIKIHSYVIPLVQNKNAQCCSVILHCCLLYSLRNILVCLCYKMFFFSHFSNQSEVVHHWSVNITDATTDPWCRRGLFRSTGSSNRLPTLKSITAQSPLFSEDWTSHRSFLFSLTDLREICLWAGEKFSKSKSVEEICLLKYSNFLYCNWTDNVRTRDSTLCSVLCRRYEWAKACFPFNLHILSHQQCLCMFCCSSQL